MKNNIRKVTFVIPALHSGGMERVMSELVNFFSEKKELEIHLILYGKTREIFYSLNSEIQIHKPNFQFNEKFRVFSTLCTLFSIRLIVKRIQPESILSFGEYWNNMVLLSLIGLRYPLYISDRCQPDKSFKFPHNILRKWLYPRASGIIAQTDFAKDAFLRLKLNNNIVTIGNPIREIKDHSGVLKQKNILSIGRLIDSKHFDRLINIFHNIKHSDWMLIIVGGDALKQKNRALLQKQINNLCIEQKVFLEGNQREVDDYYLSSTIFAFTSSSEGFPNVIGEAMSAGLPVVAYDCVAGPSEMIEDGKNGFLIPLFDDVSFEAKLRFLMENEEERIRMGAYARESIKRFSVSNIGEEYYKILLGEA